MKKALSLLLATLLCFAAVLFAGCDTNVPEATETTGSTEQTTLPETESETVKAEASKGTTDGNVYKNEFLGFEFTKPTSWVYSTDEEIAAAMNIAVDQILGENFKQALENNPVVYDMMVVDSMTGTNISVIYENLEKSFMTNITEEQYIELVKQQLASVSGMTVSFPDQLEKAKLGKTEFTKCVCSTTANGMTFTQIYYLYNVDGYMVSITATIPSGYTVADIEAMFK